MKINLWLILLIFAGGYCLWRILTGKGMPKTQKEIREEEKASSLNTYINNLGFSPTRICVTLGYTKDKYVSMYSQTTMNVISQGMTLDKARYPYGFWSPELGVFMDVKQKVFAVRSDANETTPKVGCGCIIMLFSISIDLIPKLFPHSIAFIEAS